MLNRIVKSIRSISIFSRLVIIFFAAVILPAITISSVSLKRASNEIESNLFNFTFQFIYDVNKNTDNLMKRYSDLANEISEDKTIKELLIEVNEKYRKNDHTYHFEDTAKKINNELYYYSNDDLFIENIMIITDYEQYTQTNVYDEVKGGGIEDLNKFYQTLNYKKVINNNGDEVWCDSSKETAIIRKQANENRYLTNYITLFKPIQTGNENDRIGIVMINISLKIFLENYIVEEILQQGNLLLIGENGVIASINENVNGPWLDEAVFEEIRNSYNGKMIRMIDEEEIMVVYQKSRITNWHLVSMLRRSEVIGGIVSIGKMTIIVALITLLLSCFLAYIVTYSISTPMKKLVVAMNSWNENNSGIAYFDESPDEVGMLSQHYNRMVGRINTLVNDVLKSEIKRKQAEIDAYQMQINSHLLYNTLDVMRWKAIETEGGDKQLSKMIASFASLLRLSTKKNDQLVSLMEEIDHVNTYIQVLKYSYEKSIILEWNDIDDEIRNAKVPKLILQPIIENSFIHGFKEKIEYRIKFDIQRVNHRLILIVMDNGKGMNESRLKVIRKELMATSIQSKRLGLRNINNRIQLTFGKEYGLSIDSKVNEGTQVKIEIPYCN